MRGLSNGGASTSVSSTNSIGEQIVAQIVQIEEVEGVSADKAYDSNVIREALAEAGKEAVIPPRSNRISPAEYDKIKY